MLINDEWDLLHDLIPILGPATENEDQDNPNNPNNEKNTNEHQKNIDLNQPMQTSEVLKKVKDTLYQAMLFYWKNEHEISCLPSILDPQIKKLDFALYEIEQTLNSLKNKYRKIKLSLPRFFLSPDFLDKPRLWNVARLLGLSQTLKCCRTPWTIPDFRMLPTSWMNLNFGMLLDSLNYP
ncbi:hypothetical protein RhiirA5_438121 [Rhizophagus irregularis]|uniref:Uncharacterized protein n=1 Tax=Rhizophagus irregularis TaxID=588596 RepID=A0A2N0NJL4_9GLOM|nr:hypothetical protein RhiirA5_438121 [Rhizophagus irregularis]